MADQPNTNQSADNATPGAEVTSLAQELGPNGLPINPPQGEAPADVDNEFILDTFFGDGTKEPPQPNAGEGQGKGSTSPAGQPDKGPLAPPAVAPTANGEEGSPQPGPSSTQQTGKEPAPNVGGDGATQTPGPGSQPAPAPQTPPAELSTEDRLRLASVDALQAQNRQLMERLAALEGGAQTGQPGTQPAPATTQPGDPNELLVPRLTVPDQLAAAIFDENPVTAKQGMEVLITAVAHNAVKAAMDRVPALIDARLSEFTQRTEAGRAVQTMEEQYFERFPQHKNELYRPLIQSIVDEKYKLFPGAPWNEVMMDSVGSTVNARLQALGIKAEEPVAQQPPTGQGQPPAQREQPAPMLDSKTRGKEPQDAGDFIADTFG